MSFIRYFNKLKYIDFLIRKKATGNQISFSKKVGLSRSALNAYLNEMRQLGFPIYFSKKSNTYFYGKEGQMVTSLFECEIDKEELKKIHGGYCLFRSFQSESFAVSLT